MMRTPSRQGMVGWLRSGNRCVCSLPACAVLGWMFTGSASSARADITFQTIALSETTGSAFGPNAGSSDVFSAFTSPFLTESGDVRFRATLNGVTSNSGAWSGGGGNAPEVLVRTGNLVPAGNASFAGVSSPLPTSSDGSIVFTSGLGASGMWAVIGGVVTPVARVGTADANLGPDATFASASNPTISNAGIAHTATLATGNGGVTSLNNAGIWYRPAGGPTGVIARSGSAGPGPALSGSEQFTSFTGLSLNNAGRIAFHASLLTGTGGVTASNDTGVWTRTSAVTQPVAREGNTGSTLGPNAETGRSFSIFSTPILNTPGKIVFNATLDDGTEGLFTNTGGTFAAVARSGVNGPGPNVGSGVNFNSLATNPAFNEQGEVAFRAIVTGTGISTSNDVGLWATVGGSLQAIAREGPDGPGPALGAGVIFASVSNSVGLNDSGQIVFTGTVSGTNVTTSNDLGLWFWDDGVLSNVLREGQLFDVNPDPLVLDQRTISTISFAAGGSLDSGRGFALNNDGDFVVTLGFNNSTSGVFVVSVPEPSAGLLPLLATVALAKRRARKRIASVH